MSASDGRRIGAFQWRHHADGTSPQPVVIINSATSVQSKYYFGFARFLYDHGFDVLAYDYRGIGASRPSTLRGFDAGWLDWGAKDFEGVLQYAASEFDRQPIYVVGHSIGGFVIGLAPSNHLIRRIFTVGAQYAYWRDYAADRRLYLLAKWNLAMPLITLAFGYFPGERLGWLEDTPRRVVRDWALSRERFEEAWPERVMERYSKKEGLLRRFASVTAPTLAVSVIDDEFGTVTAVERLLRYFKQSDRSHLQIAPGSVSETKIGHFGFFRSRFEKSLWSIPLEWLRSGTLDAKHLGTILSRQARAQ